MSKFGTLYLLASSCRWSATKLRFSFTRHVLALISSLNTASDHGEGNSKTGHLTQVSAKRPNFLRALATLMTLIVAYANDNSSLVGCARTGEHIDVQNCAWRNCYRVAPNYNLSVGLFTSSVWR